MGRTNTPVIAGQAGDKLRQGIQFAERLNSRRSPDLLGLVGVMTANAAMHSVSILVSGAAFQALDRTLPLTGTTLSNIPPILILGLTYVFINVLIAGGFSWMRGRAPLMLHVQSLPNLVFYEGAPMVFAPHLALIHTQPSTFLMTPPLSPSHIVCQPVN